LEHDPEFVRKPGRLKWRCLWLAVTALFLPAA